ncbi:MAG: anti-sigma factor antagonist [Candidatus Sumerlaeota bacterium]|nr:anti-sigma factor antagonist [Candidatus Sumerlaeota bacterium]
MLIAQVEHENGIPLIRLSGRFDGLGATVFESETAALADESAVCWVIDCANVDYLSSAGIRVIIAAEKRLRARGGKLIMCGLASGVALVLEMTGLFKQFNVADGVASALASAHGGQTSSLNRVHKIIGGVDYDLCRLASTQPCVLDLWGSFQLSGRLPLPDDLIPAQLGDLGIAVGWGGMGADRVQAAEAAGDLFTGVNFAAVRPADGYCQPDYIVTSHPQEQTVHVLSAVGLSGSPSFRLEAHSSPPFTLRTLAGDICAMCADKAGNGPVIAGIVLSGQASLISGSYFADAQSMSRNVRTRETIAGGGNILLAGLVIRSDNPDELADARIAAVRAAMGQADAPPEQLIINARGLTLKESNDSAVSDDPRDMMLEMVTAENLLNVMCVEPDTELTGARVWIYLPASTRSAQEKLLQIDGLDKAMLREEWEVIIRRVYSDAGRVLLTPLQGGFSASTFHVTGYDRDGKRLLPTVLKISSPENIRREEEACRHYVQKYILNNSAQILGTARQGSWAGLCYNFVGISGPECRLNWLRDHYMRRPVSELLPLFDRIFTDILKPWYGQPRWEMLTPYADHVPSRVFFPRLVEDAEKAFGISADEPMIGCPELGLELPNPYHGLKHVYPARRERARMWYTAVCHGDLNMQNILLDERENIYVIDFSETRPRNVVSDFARLEPIFILETARVDNGDDVRNLLEFVEGLSRAESLAAPAPFTYKGSDPMVGKAYHMICRLRRYAKTVTLFETSMLPYWLAVLEWTLPVVSYISVNTAVKRLALYVSAILWRNVLAEEPE